MANEAAIASAIEDLNRQLVPNVTATAAKYNISQTTLRRRFKGEQVSRAEAASLYHKNITNAQEKMLIRYINDLPERCLPPTPSIVKNIVEEMTGSPIGINWVSRFCARYKNEIKSLYLRNIDQNRRVADNSHFFHMFFEQVFACFDAHFSALTLLTSFSSCSLGKRLGNTTFSQTIHTISMRKAFF